MSYSFTISEATTFTITHAKHMAAKVATDLKRIQRLYREPDDADISDYETEVIELLKAGYLDTITYGYRRSGCWIEPTLRFTARDFAGALADDDDPGRIRPGANIANAAFGSYLTYSSAWRDLSDAEKDRFRRTRLPFRRTGAPEPGNIGYWCCIPRKIAGGFPDYF